MASTCSAADDDPTTPAAGSSDQSGRPWPPVSESDVVQLLNTIPKASAWLVKWRLLADYIRPYEPDWRAYHDRTKYGGDSVTMEVHPAVAKHGSQIKMVEGLLKLGFVRSERLPQNQFQMQRRRTQERTERLKQEKRSRLLTRSDNKKQHVTWQIPHEPSLLSNETNESASLLSVSVSGDQTSFCGTSTSGGDDVSESAAGDGGRQAQLSSESQLLKDQVCELTRQVRMLRAASLAHTSVKPVAPFIVKAQYWAPTSGNHPVRLQINYLDPDKAPYRVALQLQSAAGPSLYSPPCTIIDHQYVVFIAPPQPPGSCPLTLYGTTETSQLKKYCPSTWLEYKKTDDDAATATDSLRGGSAAGSTAARLTSAMKGSRRIRSDRKSSIASGASSQLRPRDSSSSANAAAPAPATSSSASAAAAASAAATFGGGGSAAPAEAAVAVAAAAAAAAAARQEVTLSLPPRREGLTHHQINEHNALNILPTCRVDPSEGPDTFDPTSDLKSHSEMKSEFTSDMADEEERADDDDDVWQARQFRALLPPGLDCPDPDHPPLTKETLELLTLGHGWSREGLEKSLSGSKTVNFLLSRSSAAAAAGLGSLSGLAGGGGGGGGGGLASVSGGGSASGGFGGSVVVAGGVPAAPRSAGGNTPSLRSTSPVYCGGSVGGGAGGGGGGGGSGGGGGVGAALSSSPSGGGGGKLSQSLAHWAPLSRPLSKTSLSEEGSTASGGGPPGSTGAPPRGGLAGAATSSAFSETGSAVALMTTLPSTPPESVQPSESVDRASSSFRSSPPATATPSPARQSRTRSRKHPASVAAAAAAAGTAAAAPPSASSTASSVSVSSSAGSALLPPAPAPPPAVATPPPSAAPLHGNAHGGSRHKPPHQPPHASSGAGQQSSSSGGKGGTHAPRR